MTTQSIFHNTQNKCSRHIN